MYIDSEGIVLRQTKIGGGRKMLLVFTRKYGKLSCGTQDNGKARSGRSTLALKPFTLGNYHIYQGNGYYNMDRAESVKSFYGIGEDLDKYMYASFVLELTDKVTPEEVPQPAVFDLLLDFFELMEKRKKKFGTPVLAYEIKLLGILGVYPQMKSCACCGRTEEQTYREADENDAGRAPSEERKKPRKFRFFSINDGGMICDDCYRKIVDGKQDSLIYDADFDIVKVVEYFARNPLGAFEKLALAEDVSGRLQMIIRKYFEYHLDVRELKSEPMLGGSL